LDLSFVSYNALHTASKRKNPATTSRPSRARWSMAHLIARDPSQIKPCSLCYAQGYGVQNTSAQEKPDLFGAGFN
jgi:hypothetical protein